MSKSESPRPKSKTLVISDEDINPVNDEFDDSINERKGLFRNPPAIQSKYSHFDHQQKDDTIIKNC